MIEEYLSRTENKTLEFKETARSIQGIVKSVIAFANTSGGIIIIGIKDKTKEIVGVNDPLLEEERLSSVITDSIVPLLVADIEIHSYREKELILIHVPHSAGPFYLRTCSKPKASSLFGIILAYFRFKLQG